MSNRKLYWWKSIVSMGVILGSMPIVHLVARVLKDNYDGTQLLGAGMAVGFVGLVMVVVGVFVKGQTRQTLLGLIGGMFYWTGWIFSSCIMPIVGEHMPRLTPQRERC